MQPPYDHLPGVLKTTVGYTGGSVPSPSYEAVCGGQTGHAEAVEIQYNPQKITYEHLLEIFWHSIDPTTVNAQFADRGTHYRTAIFYHSEEQRKAAEASKKALEKSHAFGKPIVTEIVSAKTFYPAEGYHQCYYKKNASHYQLYKEGSGRASFLQSKWGDP